MFDGLSIVTSHVHTASGVTCSESGFIDLSTEEECSGAVDYARSFNRNAKYRDATASSSYLKGCFILDGGFMYFNTHSTGGICSSCTSICRKGNT